MSSPQGRSRGIATLEMAMCLPLLVLLTVGLFWIGAVITAQAQVTIEARDRAWRSRSDGGGATPFDFERSGMVAETASRDVQVSRVVDGLVRPQARHVVLGGAWDHRQLPMTRALVWRQYIDLARRAGSQRLAEIRRLTDELGSLAGQIGGSITDFRNINFSSMLEVLTNEIAGFNPSVLGESSLPSGALAEIQDRLTEFRAEITEHQETIATLRELQRLSDPVAIREKLRELEGQIDISSVLGTLSTSDVFDALKDGDDGLYQLALVRLIRREQEQVDAKQGAVDELEQIAGPEVSGP